MKNNSVRCIGFDCGNSSIRTVVGTYDGENITTEVIHQVPNRAITINGVNYWDILNIYFEMQNGLKKAYDSYGRIDSVGISTWGIDFGFLGKSGHILGNPLCYRNEFGLKGMESVDKETKKKLFDLSGIQNHPMNSLYQLIGIKQLLPEYYENAEDILFIPDLLNYLFTGVKGTENTIASTSQLLDMRKQDYREELFEIAGIDSSLFHPVIPHGKERGKLLPAIAELLEVESVPFISVPSHDTASAVVAVPAQEDQFIFISSGTWSLIGTELHEPIINDTVYDMSFANEGGASDTITLLKNSTGMHILQNVKREMEQDEGTSYSWDKIVELSKKAGLSVSLYDPNNTKLFNPVKMIDTITELSGEKDISRIIASSYISLACSYREAIENLEKLSGSAFESIHIIGGGSKNAYLNQITADITNKKVIAGPEEATSLGTIAIQILYHDPSQTLSSIRSTIAKAVKPRVFSPQGDFSREDIYKRYLENKDYSNSLS
ncbi:MAG: rhamnulokinase family protein [Spirochaetia bacterium]